MRLAVLSDIHLAPDPALDRFRGDEDALLRLSDRLESSHDRIVLAGDIFQTDYGPRPGSHADQLFATLERYPRLAARWRQPPYTLLFGNHDAVTGDALGALDSLRLDVDGWRIWISHGHMFDPLLWGQKLPYWCSWAVGKLRRWGLRRLPDLLEGEIYDATSLLAHSAARLSLAQGPVESAAREALLGDEADVIVTGHTHRAAVIPWGLGFYANPGACSPDRLGYVSLDTASRRVMGLSER